ncbi:MAG: hypothetical protein ACKORF_06590 [Micrococcales bacterium]
MARPPSRLHVKRSPDQGSGSVLALSLILLCLGLAFLVSTVAKVATARVQLDGAVASAAIGAEDARRGVTTGYPCELAERILQANMASLDRCLIVGHGSMVSGQVKPLGIVLSATARAEPLDSAH